jgi:hypothetical protein
MPRRPPRLYRAARLLRRLGLVALVVLLVYIGIAGYSATQIHVMSIGKSVSAQTQGKAVTITAGIEVDNNGWVPIQDVSIVTFVWFPDSGGLIAQAASPVVNINAGSAVIVPVTLTVPLNLSSTARDGGVSLLTHSLNLPADTWANATYAGLATLHLSDGASVPWGAPFFELNVTVGQATVEPNGTTMVRATVFYINQAPFTEVGALHFALDSAGGISCATAQLALNVPQNATFDQAVSVAIPPSCNPAGGTVIASYAGGGLDVAFPPEPIP